MQSCTYISDCSACVRRTSGPGPLHNYNAVCIVPTTVCTKIFGGFAAAAASSYVTVTYAEDEKLQAALGKQGVEIYLNL